MVYLGPSKPRVLKSLKTHLKRFILCLNVMPIRYQPMPELLCYRRLITAEVEVQSHFGFTLPIIIPLSPHIQQTLRAGTTGQFEAAEPSNSG